MIAVNAFRFMLLPALGLATFLAVGACTTNEELQQTAISCPQAMRVLDAARLTRFRDGRGRDPTDVMVEAEISDVGLRCSVDGSRIDMEIRVRMVAVEGPALATQTPRTAPLRYFVALIDPYRRIVTRSEFAADFQFEGNRTRIATMDELTHRINLVKGEPTLGYQIAVGFVLSQDEVDYNRRAAAIRR